MKGQMAGTMNVSLGACNYYSYFIEEVISRILNNAKIICNAFNKQKLDEKVLNLAFNFFCEQIATPLYLVKEDEEDEQKPNKQ